MPDTFKEFEIDQTELNNFAQIGRLRTLLNNEKVAANEKVIFENRQIKI